MAKTPDFGEPEGFRRRSRDSNSGQDRGRSSGGGHGRRGSEPVGSLPPAFAQGGNRGVLYADFKHRLGSGLVDYIPTIGVPWLLLDGTAWFVVTTLLVLANSGVYQGMTGQSVGKKLLRLQLVYPVVPAADPDDMATALVPGVGRTILRQFLHIFDTLPLFYGFYRVSTDRRHRTFADSWVGTDVMRAENKLINLMDDPGYPDPVRDRRLPS